MLKLIVAMIKIINKVVMIMNNDDDAGGDGESAAGGEVGGDGRSEFRERGGKEGGELRSRFRPHPAKSARTGSLKEADYPPRASGGQEWG